VERGRDYIQTSVRSLIVQHRVWYLCLCGYSVGPKYEFVLRGKGIVERVAGTFSGCCQ
jgi:hypothetical protein